jgi:hypothetical protein
MPSAEQVEPKIEPEYRGAPGESSLVYEQDLIAGKPRTDVYVNGTAYAPGGRPVTEMTVGLSTPMGRKTLRVVGDRRWERNLVGLVEPGPTVPFVEMPIVYERAYGGFDKTDPDPAKNRLDPRNPIGTGHFTAQHHKVGKPLPNIEFPDGDVARGPAGFGALCSYWQPRMKYQGTYDAAWIEKRKPLLPDDYDPQFLQCAPVDQQAPATLRGGEPFGVVGMTPGAGAVTFALPKHYFGLATRIGKNVHEHRARMQTVIIEPTFPRVIVVWHSTLSCHHEIDDIDWTEITEKQYV